MTRWVSRSLLIAGFAFAPLVINAAQTTPPAARRGAPPAGRQATPPAGRPTAPPAPQAAAPAGPKLDPGTYAHFVTSMGNFTLHLFDKDAPKTVANFVGLATGKKAWKDPRSGQMVHRPYYSNVLFHRVIPEFMIQGGDPLGNGTGGPGFEVPDEFNAKLRHNKVGIVSMANTGRPNTNGGQFFITVSANLARLDDHYSVFGEVIQGMDVVTAISQVKTAAENRPVTPIVIQSVRIEIVPAT
jgi:peptidyl-prolyl cis-trans isomerase A (cyclophilin A)